MLEAKDGEDALTILDGYQGALDLLLTDVMMPGLSGAEVCDRVREGRPGLPTLFISGVLSRGGLPGPPAARRLGLPGRSRSCRKS